MGCGVTGVVGGRRKGQGGLFLGSCLQVKPTFCTCRAVKGGGSGNRRCNYRVALETVLVAIYPYYYYFPSDNEGRSGKAHHRNSDQEACI